jgi:hypothetical protein
MVDADTLGEFAATAAPSGDEEARLRWLQRRLRDAPGHRAPDRSSKPSSGTSAMLVTRSLASCSVTVELRTPGRQVTVGL